MLLSKDLNGEAAIVGLDQAVSLNDIYDSSSELHHQGEVIPPGDLFFTSFEVNPTHIRKIRPIAFPAIPKLFYRHDLESFLYLIIYTICHLDLERVRWIGTNGPSITAASNLLNLIFDVSGEGARQASIENLRANAVGPRSDLDINMRMPVPQQKLKEMNGCNELSIRVASEKLQFLKEQFIMMSVPAIERSREEYNSGEASPDGRGKPFSRLYDEHRLKLFFGDRMGGDDLHERMLLKLIRSMPNDFGNQVVLPLQDLFRSGYEAKRAWEERVTTQQKERNIEVLLVKKSAANEEAEVANKMLSEVLAKHRCIEEEVFDDETLGGHVTFEKVWEILEDYYPSRY
ncbi:hypothetical protein DL93DRAFT_743523 [Clavulina sp. PMI_390]|nr:hypothetical protein DL93DRAFT_743523 [Clavulina sp. PMI_390]